MTSALPPYASLLGISAEADGTLVMPFGDEVLGRPGFLHGGAIAGLLEMALHKALRDALEAELGNDYDPKLIKPVNVTITYMRGGRERVTYARATVERLGSRVANVVAHAWQDDPAAPIASAACNFLKA